MKFIFPREYIYIDEQGWADGNNFIDVDNVKQKYLWMNSMEWFTINKIKEILRSENTLLIPFAQNGRGDNWSWMKQDNVEDCPVLLVLHEEERAIYYAPNFKTALFRQILDFCSEGGFYSSEEKKSRSDMDIVLAKKYLKEWCVRMGNIFPEEYINLINNFIKRDLVEYQIGKYKEKSLISLEEADMLVKRYLDFPYLNKRMDTNTYDLIEKNESVILL